MATYLADRVIMCEGIPSSLAEATKPQPLVTGGWGPSVCETCRVQVYVCEQQERGEEGGRDRASVLYRSSVSPAFVTIKDVFVPCASGWVDITYIHPSRRIQEAREFKKPH